ncbi:cbb3-type cytochrome oxidase assembly protein CcoS [Dyella jiangningensis]|jgi:cbb3-type cytochrome oxidase maturation protein|uniref:cbb3-type cytochrome oxidase assembly protein CcoS n=1 Tax=Dyella jiangningensis TaxID=1379159 RepID=UPI00240EA41E|nr:cbb3-type cytochrome oxidase assembly protein CcoS [Dyella jiangningensis]MDG2539002.1 cbb3-type cytochrome oxidase assembly protein CcoS [Dyella jiangningensis]
MNILLALIPVTLLIVVCAIGIFFWAVNHRQFDDLDSPGVLPLMEEDPIQPIRKAEAPETGESTGQSPRSH